MLKDGILMLVILNPFAQMLYLSDLMNDVPSRQFRKIFVSATLLTTGICILFAGIGEYLLYEVFQVSLPAMRIFGGLIIFSVAYSYIIRGPEGLRLFKGDVSEIAQQITLPLMVGPGIIWISIKIGKSYILTYSSVIIFMVMFINCIFVLFYQLFLKKAKGPVEIAIIKYFAIAMRLNALMIGAVSVDMVLSGIAEYNNMVN
ncbi:MarC family protein [Planctomycetota bacterium]